MKVKSTLILFAAILLSFQDAQAQDSTDTKFSKLNRKQAQGFYLGVGLLYQAFYVKAQQPAGTKTVLHGDYGGMVKLGYKIFPKSPKINYAKRLFYGIDIEGETFLLRGNYFVPKSFQLAIGPSITIRASQKANNTRSRYLYFTPSLVYSLFQYSRAAQNDWSERDFSNTFIHNRITSFSGIGAKLKFEYVTGMLYTAFSLGVTVHPAVKGDGTMTWRAISEYNNHKMLAVSPFVNFFFGFKTLKQ